MKISAWLKNNTASLAGKTVAISGSTGGIGKELCSYLAYLGADLLLLDRNKERSEAHRKSLLERYGNISVELIPLDLEDQDSVSLACHELKQRPVDVLICNAGAYSIPRHTCKSGYDNVFQINFASPYLMIKELLPTLRERKGRVVVVGSVAHNYSKADPSDVDFSKRRKSSLVYGNSKRYLMYTLASLFENEPDVGFAITHPGITFTNITAHYPPLIFAIIKHPMKIIFPPPKKACLSILRGVFEDTKGAEWIGPRLFDVWGYPQKKKLTTAAPWELEYFSKWNADVTNAERKK